MRTIFIAPCLLAGAVLTASAGEKTVVSLRDFCESELKSAGFSVQQSVTVHVKSQGGGGNYGWTYKSEKMFAYGWIINADTRELVWKMDAKNTTRSRDDRMFDGTITLHPGSYEIYFAVPVFEYHTTFTHMRVDIDQRQKPLFGPHEKKRGPFSWFSDWWSDDLAKEWRERCKGWGIDLLIDETMAPQISDFSPPKRSPAIVLKSVAAGENAFVRQGFSLSAPTTITIYALGEGQRGKELSDGAWIIDAHDRNRVWEMTDHLDWAGGAKKNQKYSGAITLNKGDYVLYYVSDGSHSAADWNDEPPDDPLNWGVTLSIESERERKNFALVAYSEDKNIIVSLVGVKDNEFRSEGFTLKEDTRVRVYCIGERSNSRRVMADYGAILDARTRAKVWTMDADRTLYAGGASKNRQSDEIITLPRGSYIVTYTTDDSHAANDWNDDPPSDADHYGITVMGVGEKFNRAAVSRYVEERDKNIIAQIIRPGNDADRGEAFSLEKTTKVRIYAIGEGQNREMYDYGSIEDVRTGSVLWEMTYAMTFHAGGGRKNRMVNTTILLEKGEYRLRWRSDDSHSYGDWNVEAPEDQQYWGITLYRDDGTVPPPIVHPPIAPPLPPKRGEN